MNKIIYNNEFTTDVQATVVGDAEIEVESFSDIKCPFCGRNLRISGIDWWGGDEYHYDTVGAVESSIDGAGIRHTRFFGTKNIEKTSKIMMCCPARCIENMTVNIKDVVVGEYGKLKEISTFEGRNK